MAKKKTSVTITAAIIGAIAVILGAILTPFVQDWLTRPAMPTPTPTATTVPTATVAPTVTDSPIILNPTWIDRQGSVLVLNNQVLIHVEQLNYGFMDTVDMSVTIGTETEQFRSIKPGEREIFQYLGVDYSVTVMQIIGTQTQISVERIFATK